MTQQPTIPGYLTGTWTIDPGHSEVSFTVRHLMMTRIRGRFSRFSGQLTTAANPLESRVSAEIDMASIDTNNAARDADLSSGNFFDIETFPVMTYHSTSLEPDGDAFLLRGDLTCHGVTAEVPLRLAVNGFGTGRFGDRRAAFTATGELSRKAFGISLDLPLDGGGVVIGDRIEIGLEIQAVLG
ncbi:YceI family protein [Kribbella sancticallisti]|uniref:YceI family protein n=1 Tax=Kribbella sancticallisti TaxID=460087 RepID=A0ABP4QVV1_9ACTN